MALSIVSERQADQWWPRMPIERHSNRAKYCIEHHAGYHLAGEGCYTMDNDVQRWSILTIKRETKGQLNGENDIDYLWCNSHRIDENTCWPKRPSWYSNRSDNWIVLTTVLAKEQRSDQVPFLAVATTVALTEIRQPADIEVAITRFLYLKFKEKSRRCHSIQRKKTDLSFFNLFLKAIFLAQFKTNHWAEIMMFRTRLEIP